MKTKQGKVAEAKSEPVRALPKACADEAAAVEFIETQRWQGEPNCPRCGDLAVYQMKDRKTGQRSSRYLWRCRGCGDQFTVRIGSIFEDSRIPLRHWCYAFWAACASKKGVSALQIKRMTGLSYKSALFMMHRVRFAMTDSSESPAQLTGIVEVDEAYCGGKPRMHGAVNKGKAGRGTDKAAVIGVLQRGGHVRPAHVEKPNVETLRNFILQNVDQSATLMSDEYLLYRNIGKHFASHQTVNHSKRQYAKGIASTNSIESFFAIIKRSLYGTHHAVSRKHLHRYLSERAFVFNARNVEDGERTVMAIRKASGKRLTYAEYVG